MGTTRAETMAALRSVTPVAGQNVATHSFASEGDGGGGLWRGVTGASAGTYTHNGGTVIVPSGGDGSAAWLRVYTGGSCPEWWGAARDGSTDDAAAIQSAVDNTKSVQLSEGTYSIASTVVIPNGVELFGSGEKTIVRQTGTNLSALMTTASPAANDVIVRDLTIKGNGDGQGSTPDNGGAGGHGIEFNGSARIRVERVKFETIGNDAVNTYFACPIRCDNCEELTVSGCRFSSDCLSPAGADIQAFRLAAKSFIVGNYSESECDQFAALSADFTGAADGSDNTHHVVCGNQAFRTNEAARHGVMEYDAVPIKSTITGNIFSGFIWTGVYLANANAAAKTTPAGGATIAGNIIEFCGGTWDDGGPITAGIYVSGELGATVSGNHLYKCGFQPDGTQREDGGDDGCASILVRPLTQAVSVTGNTILDGTRWGIAVRAASGNVRDVTISGNTVVDGGDEAGIYLSTEGSGTVLSNVKVTGNTVTNTDYDAHGIQFVRTSSGIGENITIHDNTCEYTPGSGTKNGIEWGNSADTGRITHNTCVGFNFGYRVLAGSDRDCPDNLWIQSNEARDCAVGFNTGNYGVVFDGKTINCTNYVTGNTYMGHYIGTDGSGNALVDVTINAAPGAGLWRRGDRRTNRAPSASGKIGGVCVSGGTPGTWKEWGAIDA